MKKRKVMAVLASVMAVSLVMSACGTGGKTQTAKPAASQKLSENIKGTDPSKLPQSAKDRADTLVVGTTALDGKFNPLYSDGVYDTWAVSLMFDGMIMNDEKGNPIPWLADKWEISSDMKTYTFHLKKDAKFSDGSLLTADDVAFTYTTLCDPAYDGARTDAVDHLQGLEEYRGKLDDKGAITTQGTATSVSGIKVIDANTISFTLTSVKATGIWDYGYGILSKKYYNFEKGHADQLKAKFLKPMGTGSYTFVEHKAGQNTTFKKNGNYFLGAPKIGTIIMKTTTDATKIQELATGGVDIDMVGAKPESATLVKNAGFLDYTTYDSNGYRYIGLNLRNDMFKDVKVRQALMYGLNRQQFVDGYYKGYASVCNQPTPEASWAYNANVETYKYDKAKAAKLMDDAGWKLGTDGIREKDGKKFIIHWLLPSGNKKYESLLNVATSNWKEIGVSVVPNVQEFGAISSAVYEKQNFEAYAMGWSLSIDPDQAPIFGIAQDKMGGFNSVGWRNQEGEKLLQDDLATTDIAKRKDIMKKWNKLINQELPYLFLVYEKDMYVSSSRVKGLHVSPFIDWTNNIQKLELVK